MMLLILNVHSYHINYFDELEFAKNKLHYIYIFAKLYNKNSIFNIFCYKNRNAKCYLC